VQHSNKPQTLSPELLAEQAGIRENSHWRGFFFKYFRASKKREESSCPKKRAGIRLWELFVSVSVLEGRVRTPGGTLDCGEVVEHCATTPRCQRILICCCISAIVKINLVLLQFGSGEYQLLLNSGVDVLRALPPILGTGFRFPLIVGTRENWKNQTRRDCVDWTQ
jgi:hypothetical protein